jgi:acid phosphatase class B
MNEVAPKKKCIMVDLDGTISLFNHITKNGKEQVEQHPGAHFRNSIDASTAEQDLPNHSVIQVIKMAFGSGHTIIFCSGRIDRYEEQTRNFLAKHLPDVPYQLFLRRDGDFRKDTVLKEEVFRDKIEPYYDVSFVLEDRSCVVEMFRDLGLNCWQVHPGDF